MTKREMMGRYYEQVDLHSAELALKYGIEDGSIKLVGSEISGNTYAARAAIKEYFGAKWNAARKSWEITKDQAFAEKIFRDGLMVY